MLNPFLLLGGIGKMKILQYYNNNQVRLGLLEGEEVFPIDYSGDMIGFISEEPEIIKKNPIPLDKIEFAPAFNKRAILSVLSDQIPH